MIRGSSSGLAYGQSAGLSVTSFHEDAQSHRRSSFSPYRGQSKFKLNLQPRGVTPEWKLLARRVAILLRPTTVSSLSEYGSLVYFKALLLVLSAPWKQLLPRTQPSPSPHHLLLRVLQLLLPSGRRCALFVLRTPRPNEGEKASEHKIREFNSKQSLVRYM